MNAMADGLWAGLIVPPMKDRGEAVYFRSMDYILYLRQDSNYVADRIDEWLTLLLDPVRGEPIGVKLKGFHNIYLEMKRVFELFKVDLENKIPFRSFINCAEMFALQIGDGIVDDTATRLRYDAYQIARTIVGPITVSAAEFGHLEAA